MTPPNWYPALCEELGVDLIELNKKFGDSIKNRITDRSLRNYRKTGDVPTRESVKAGILELIQKDRPDFTREPLERYWCANAPEVSLIKSALEAFGEEAPLLVTLMEKLNVEGVSDVAQRICAIIAAGDEGRPSLMGLLGDPLKRAIEQAQSPEDIARIEKLIGNIVLTTVQPEKRFREEGEFKIALKHDDELWTLRVLVDAHRSYPKMTGIIPNQESQLDVSGVVKLGIETSGTTATGRLLALHRAVSLITDHLGLPRLRCPDLNAGNKHREFYDFARPLRNELIATNDGDDHILACIGEDASDELKNDLIDYFTDEDDEMALRLMHISTQTGHRPLRIKAGPFSSWLVRRLLELRQREHSILEEKEQSLSRTHKTLFISYGGPDEEVVSEINRQLRQQGISTWFFPNHAEPGQKLHRVMHNGVNEHDHVLLVCSRNSLTRPGVLNEIERVLEREAKEGGSEILIPVSLDEYVHRDWAPERPDIADQVRSRVIPQLDVGSEGFGEAISKIVKVLKAN